LHINFSVLSLSLLTLSVSVFHSLVPLSLNLTAKIELALEFILSQSCQLSTRTRYFVVELLRRGNIV